MQALVALLVFVASAALASPPPTLTAFHPAPVDVSSHRLLRGGPLPALKLAAGEHAFSLELHPADLFTADASATVVGGAEDGAAVAIDRQAYYSVSSPNDPLTFGHATVHADGHLHASFVVHGIGYAIAPARDHPALPAQGANHFLYREDAQPGVKSIKDLAIDSIKAVRAPADATDADAPAVEEARRRRAYVAGKYQCSVRIVADSTFYAGPGGNSVNSALAAMTARFNIAKQVFTATTVAVMGAEHPLLKISKVTFYATSGADPMYGTADASSYLDALAGIDFSSEPTCLTHAYTNRDFSGVLGLAWVGDAQANVNGGICSTRSSGKTLNTGFSTSTNFGSSMTTVMSGLVNAHEFGHNFGSTHDAIGAEPGSGYYLMYPYATDGSKANNDEFSSDSKVLLSSVINSKGSCFTIPQDVCGNAVQEGNEECDCGSASVCASDVTSFDTCCSTTGSCTFRANKDCTPKDVTNGMCCNADCTFKAGSDPCGTEHSCQQAPLCDGSGTCQAAQNKADNTQCEPTQQSCTGDHCSMLCNAGACTRSICFAWSLTAAASVPGADTACLVRCDDNGTPKTTDQLAATPLSPATQGHKYYKGAGAACEFTAGEPGSGTCKSDGTCAANANDEALVTDLFGSLFGAFDGAKEWFLTVTAGVPNYGWVIIGVGVFVLLIILIVKCRGSSDSVTPSQSHEMQRYK